MFAYAIDFHNERTFKPPTTNPMCELPLGHYCPSVAYRDFFPSHRSFSSVFTTSSMATKANKEVTPKRQRSFDSEPITPSAATPKVSAKLASTFTKARDAEAESLLDDVGQDLELMLCVRHFVKEYKETLARGKEAGSSLGDMVASTVAARKRRRDGSDDECEDAAEEEDEPDDVPFGELKRHQFVFGKWNLRLIEQALRHIDPHCMTRSTLKMLTLEDKKQILEMVTEIKFFGDELDRVHDTDCQLLFPAMKRVYSALGDRCQFLVVDPNEQCVLWGECAPWCLKEQKKNEVTVILRRWAALREQDLELTLSSDHLFDDEGPFELEFGFSVRQGRLRSQSTTEIYTLATMMPNIRRTLGRRPSDVEGATNAVRKTSAQAKQELSDKRAKKTTNKVAINLGDRKAKASGAAQSPAKTKASATEATVTKAETKSGGKVNSGKAGTVAKSAQISTSAGSDGAAAKPKDASAAKALGKAIKPADHEEVASEDEQSDDEKPPKPDDEE